MHTILGAGGAIGTQLLKELARTGQPVRLVARSPKSVPGATEIVPADLSIPDQAIRAVSGAAVVSCQWRSGG